MLNSNQDDGKTQTWLQYELDPSTEITARIGETPPVVLQMFRDAGMSPRIHELTDAEHQALTRAFRILPPLHQRILAERLRCVSFLDDMPNTALTSTVNPEESFLLFDITIRAAILHQTVSDWLTEKEMTCFEPGESPFHVSVEAGELDAVAYVLLHEVSHVMDRVLGITPPVGNDGKPLEDPAAHAFTAGIWDDRSTASLAYRQLLLEQVSFRPGGKPFAPNQAIDAYTALRKTPYASLYGSSNWFEDFAEFMTVYHMTEKLGQPFRIVVRRDGREMLKYEPMQSDLVRRRTGQLDCFYQ
jgi:hypothetical protein